MSWSARFAPTWRPGAIELCVESFIAQSRYKASTQVLANPTLDELGNYHEPYPVCEFLPISDTAVRKDRAAWNALVVDRIKILKPDVVIVQQTTHTAAAIRRVYPNLPVILHRHDAQVPGSPLKHWGQNWQMRSATKVVANSDFVKRHLAKRCWLPNSKIAKIYNSLDFKRLSQTQPKQKNIVCVASLMPRKGPELFAGAVRAVLQAHPDWSIDFVAETSGKSTESWRDGVRALVSGLPAHQFRQHDFLPYDQILELYAKSSIAVVPSKKAEAFGRTALEACAAKAALVTSGLGGLKEIAGPYAIYPEQQSPEAYTKALLDLIENEADRIQLAEQAYKRAKDLFDVPQVSAAYDLLIDEVLKDVT